MLKKGFAAISMLALVGCNTGEKVSGGPEAGPAETPAASKPPLRFDESRLLYPPTAAPSLLPSGSGAAEGRVQAAPLAKTAATYYQFFIGSQISEADYKKVYENSSLGFTCASYARPIFLCPDKIFTEATYSSRLAAKPESTWNINGDWVQTGYLLDNEQAEMHFQWNMAGARWDYDIKVEYEVSSETGYDYLYINSTASDGSCNSPGVIRKKVSGQQSGTVYFRIPPACGTGWLGIYYIKDGSLRSFGDYARIKKIFIGLGG
jgi:hypothetical protein